MKNHIESKILSSKSSIKYKKSKIRNTFLFFGILTFFLSITDLDVFLLKIPELDQLETSEGTIDFNLAPLSRGSSLIIRTKEKTIELNCWITSNGMKDCVSKNDKSYLRGKKAKAWWYVARINGFSNEKRLLQLEVDGNTFINYFEQRNKYIESKSSYIYVWPSLFCVSMFFYIVTLLSNSYRNQ